MERVFHAARALSPQERKAFLDKACAGDSELRVQVEALLAEDRNPLVKTREKSGPGESTIPSRELEPPRPQARDTFDRFFERNASRVLIYINYQLAPRLRRKVDPSHILEKLHARLHERFESLEPRTEKRVREILLQMAKREIIAAYGSHLRMEEREAQREITSAYEKGSRDSFPLSWTPDPKAAISGRVVRQEEYQRMMAVLRGLRPLEQFVTVSRIIAGCSTEEIAGQTGQSREAVQTIIARVRDGLREQARPETDP